MGWAGLQWTAWAMHYAPFFIMERQLFLHHYLPALYFSILCLSCLFDAFLRKITRSQSVEFGIIGIVCAAAVYVFYLYSPLTYGWGINKGVCESLKLRSGWDWDCQRFEPRLGPTPS